MDRLDACYFCGAAGEAPLREVSIAPRARRGDPDATVATTLCPSCEGKLETVLGHLFDHVESRRVEDEAAATDAADEGGGTATDEGDDAAAVEADQPVDRIDVAAEPAEWRRGGRDRRRLFDRAPDIHEVPGAGPSEEATSSGGDAPPEAPAQDASGPADTDPAGESTGADPAEGDAEIISDDDEPAVRTRASSTAGDRLDGVSVADYNRVMRLLQNREFPVAREAFVDLASSAYDLETATVQQVLDAVLDKGALAERDGDLVRPDGAGGAAP